MTQREFLLKYANKKELANMLIRLVEDDHCPLYKTSDNSLFFDEGDAIDHEIEWLNSPIEACFYEGIFNKEEVYDNCTVQILSNTVTGDISVGWWKNDEVEE